MMLLALGVGMSFAVVALVLFQILPKPLDGKDYLVIGSVATLGSLVTLFLALIMTSLKGSDTFFKRRE